MTWKISPHDIIPTKEVKNQSYKSGSSPIRSTVCPRSPFCKQWVAMLKWTRHLGHISRSGSNSFDGQDNDPDDVNLVHVS